MKKRTKIILIVVGVLIVLLFVLGLFAGNTLYNLALNPNQDRSIVFNADHNSMTDVKMPGDDERLAAKEWFATAAVEDYSMESRDHLKLHALTLKQEDADNHLWAILCHGYGGQAKDNTTSAHRFYTEGFNIMMPDARGHGTSEGDYIGMGWDDRLDIVDWIDLIIQEDPDAQIVLYGVSMGAATVMMVSGEELPENVKVIVEDCGYTSVWDEFSYQLKMLFNIPGFPAMNFASLVTKVRSGWWIGEGSAIKQVAKSVTPMMFIHGDADTFVPTFMLDEVYDEANVEKEKLLVEGAGHGGSAGVLGDEYWEKVFNFVDQYLEK